MGLLDKIKSLVGADDIDEEEFDERIVNRKERSSNRDNNINSSGVSENTDNGRVVNIRAQAKVKVVILKPERFQDASSVVDNLKDNKTVVLNLESTNKDASRRIIDFSSGAAYANNGQIKCIANRTFIITPYNVDVVGEDVIDELENNGVFFK